MNEAELKVKLDTLDDAILSCCEDSKTPDAIKMLNQVENPEIIAENNNQLLNTAIITSAKIAHQLLQIPAVITKLKASAKCESLLTTLNTALLLDKNQIICEVAAKIWPNWTAINKYPNNITENNKQLHETIGVKQMHAYMHHKRVANFLFAKVGEDVPKIILDFVGEQELENQPITRANINKIYKLKPKN